MECDVFSLITHKAGPAIVELVLVQLIDWLKQTSKKEETMNQDCATSSSADTTTIYASTDSKVKSGKLPKHLTALRRQVHDTDAGHIRTVLKEPNPNKVLYVLWQGLSSTKQKDTTKN